MKVKYDVADSLILNHLNQHYGFDINNKDNEKGLNVWIPTKG